MPVAFPFCPGWLSFHAASFPSAVSLFRLQSTAYSLDLLHSVFRYRVQFRRSRYLPGDKTERNLNKANQYSNPPPSRPPVAPRRPPQPPPTLSSFPSFFPYLFPCLSALSTSVYIDGLIYSESLCRTSRSPFSRSSLPRRSLPPFLGSNRSNDWFVLAQSGPCSNEPRDLRTTETISPRIVILLPTKIDAFQLPWCKYSFAGRIVRRPRTKLKRLILNCSSRLID